MAIKVESEVECYEVDGKEPGAGTHPKPSITVRSHWNRSSYVVLHVGGQAYTFSARELMAAIANAQNRGSVT